MSDAASSFLVVAVGASAGGLAPTSELLRALGAQPGLALVIIHHLAPTHPSGLVDILARATSLPVAAARDGLRVEPNHVYVITPNAGLLILGGRLRVVPRDEPGGVHHPIDRFFESLALDRAGLSGGVVLSGVGFDGTDGIRAIKREGGITLAQDATAEFGSMPESAIATGCVDFIRPPAGLARELRRLGAQAAHEEVVASNRELRSANDELQNAKEELQSINEELRTVNEEMRERTAEATKLSDDLTNVLTSVEIPILLIGRDLCLRRFTPAAARLFGLLASDSDRAVSDLPHLIALAPTLARTVLEVLEHPRAIDSSIKDAAGHHYALSVRPYLTADGRVDGAVVAGHDVDAQTKSAERVGAARAHAQGVVDAVRDGLTVPDLGLEQALAWLGEDLEKRHGIKIEVSDDGTTKPLDDASKGVVFRAVRELLMNVVKHAKAPGAKVTVTRSDDHCRIDVEDRGAGFDPDATLEPGTGGFGLLNAGAQIARLGGKLEIQSAPGRGTLASVRVPLQASVPRAESKP